MKGAADRTDEGLRVVQVRSQQTAGDSENEGPERPHIRTADSGGIAFIQVNMTVFQQLDAFAREVFSVCLHATRTHVLDAIHFVL
ncbi:putative uncharacterized protein [Novosphingobium sp. PY1]|nr:putative uncharacterized protein [Novosphingobium sp. PY1]